ncbi:MAG: hypothetical protein NVSMB3_03340 [Acidobacteriaceae bacterium]
MNFTLLDNVLWAAGFAGHAALLCILLICGRWRKFPVFTVLIAFHAAETAILFLLSRMGATNAYRVVYWAAAAGSFALQLGLIYEIAATVLRPTGSWVRDARRSFLLWSGVGVLVAFAAAMAVTPAASSALGTWEVRGMLFTSLLTCEVFLAMSAAANRLGLPWRSHVMALGQGLTVWAVMALMSDAAHIALGWNRDFAVLDYTRMLFYLGALGFWIVSFWMPERERAAMSPDMREYLVALHNRVQYDLDRLSASKKPLL